MAAIAINEQSAKLDLGRVFQQTFEVLQRSPAVFFGLAGSGAVVAALSMGAQRNVLASGAAVMASGPYWLSLLLMTLVSAFVQSGLLYAGVRRLQGQRPPLGEVLTTAAKLFVPVFVVMLLYYLAVFAGALLLIVPGVMIGIAWSVAFPALVIERTGIMKSFGRSAELTRGSRWRIFGVALLYTVLSLVLTGVLQAFGLSAGVVNPVSVIGSIVITTVATAVMAALASALYVQLRSLKEGLGGGSVAEVFD
jgi:hypothetical protein